MTNPVVTPPTSLPTRANLGRGRAIWNALWGRKADFYPRIAENGAVSTLDTVPLLEEMRQASARWPALDNNEDLKVAIDLARQSLTEVRAQTEYQDQKATRLLTITTFLGALSGALFSQFEDSYPISAITNQNLEAAVLVSLGYIGFGAFVIMSLSGALVTFHATRTRFKYPPNQTTDEQESDPESLLFYGGLIRSRPRAWMRGWVTAGGDGDAEDGPAVRHDLRQRYFRHLASETYLVAAKTADKLRLLEPAQSLLAISLRCLFVWLLLLALVGIVVPSTKPTKPVEVTLVSPLSPIDPAKRGILPVAPAPANGDTGQHP